LERLISYNDVEWLQSCAEMFKQNTLRARIHPTDQFGLAMGASMTRTPSKQQVGRMCKAMLRKRRWKILGRFLSRVLLVCPWCSERDITLDLSFVDQAAKVSTKPGLTVFC
jgi:hypothetical protein